jgi:hypothetical protein
MSIYRPLSIGGNWTHDSQLLTAYADSAFKQLTAGHYFDAVLICCVGYDVLVNILVDRLSWLHFDGLTPEQKKVIKDIQARHGSPAGTILCRLRKAGILNSRLDCALSEFNQERNKVIHPIKIGKGINSSGKRSYLPLPKPGAIFPRKATKQHAERYFRRFCWIIDLSGGESPRKKAKARRAYPSFLEQVRQAQGQTISPRFPK